MRQWEHLVFELYRVGFDYKWKVQKINGQPDPEWGAADPLELHEIINAWAVRGWEVAGIHGTLLILKRPVQGSVDQQTTQLPDYSPR